MKADTRFFGEIEVGDDKILTFDEGILGFSDMKRWTILFDNSNGEKSSPISWFQSLDDPALALPVMSPFTVTDDYSPMVEDELLAPLGDFKDEDLLILLALSVPAGHPENTTANFKAPLLINPVNRKGIQIVVNNEDYDIRTNVRDMIEKKKTSKV